MYQIPFRAIDLADGEWINGTCYGRTIEEARKALKDIKLTGQVDEDIFIDTSTLEINLDGIVM